MPTINSKEINDKIASLPSREDLSKELQRQEDIAAINDYALRNPNKVFDEDFTRLRLHLTEETWKAVILANPDMLDSASPKWRHIPNADIVNKYQGQAFSGEVRKAINEDGVELAGLAAAVPGAIIGGGTLAKPVLSLMFYHPGTFFAETIGGTIGGYAGGAATDAITRGVSDYNSFADIVASNSTIPELYTEMLNPGMLLGGLAGGVGGNVLYNNVVKPTVQRAALPYLMARLLNKNIDNTVLPLERTVRLYRGTGTNGPISPDGGAEQAGQWFTPIKTKTGAYLSNLLAYAKRKGINNPTFLEYVDIPESLLGYYHAKRVLDPKKVEFEPNEDYLIPLHLKRNKIKIPHFTNSQERLDLHSGQSLPETPFNPSNTLWDTSKHIYYDIESAQTASTKVTPLTANETPELLDIGPLIKKYYTTTNLRLYLNQNLIDIPDRMPHFGPQIEQMKSFLDPKVNIELFSDKDILNLLKLRLLELNKLASGRFAMLSSPATYLLYTKGNNTPTLIGNVSFSNKSNGTVGIGMVNNYTYGPNVEKGVSEDLYNLIIHLAKLNGMKGLESGRDLRSPLATTKIWEKYPNKIILNETGGAHTIDNVITPGPIVLLTEPSKPLVPLKSYLFDPSIIKGGKMIIDWNKGLYYKNGGTINYLNLFKNE